MVLLLAAQIKGEIYCFEKVINLSGFFSTNYAIILLEQLPLPNAIYPPHSKNYTILILVTS